MTLLKAFPFPYPFSTKCAPNLFSRLGLINWNWFIGSIREISKGKREGQIRIRWVHFHSFAKMGYTFEKLEKNKEIKLCQIVYENGEFVAQVSHYREKLLDYLWSVQKYLFALYLISRLTVCSLAITEHLKL